jgi:hypothetical protein
MSQNQRSELVEEARVASQRHERRSFSQLDSRKLLGGTDEIHSSNRREMLINGADAALQDAVRRYAKVRRFPEHRSA